MIGNLEIGQQSNFFLSMTKKLAHYMVAPVLCIAGLPLTVA